MRPMDIAAGNLETGPLCTGVISSYVYDKVFDRTCPARRSTNGSASQSEHNSHRPVISVQGEENVTMGVRNSAGKGVAASVSS